MSMPLYLKRSEKLNKRLVVMIDESTDKLVSEADQVLDVRETIRYLIRENLPKAIERAKNKTPDLNQPSQI